MIKHSATLAINEKMAARKAADLPAIHLGFGEAGLPVPDDVADVLRGAVDANAYAPVAGSLAAREAVAGYFERRGLSTRADQVIMAPGSKALLYASLATLPGDLLLPVPSWVSYAAQAELTHKKVVGVPVPEQAGGVPNPTLLEQAIVDARKAGNDPRVMILTLPDNPTGTLAGAELVRQVCDIAGRHDITIISDEIYRDLTYQPENFLSPATLLPEQTIVTGGLSKNMALGGWRIGFARLPRGARGEELRHEFIGIASEVWSCLPGPMQAVAAYVLAEPDPVQKHIAASRRLHATVAKAVHAAFTDIGAQCRQPTAAFYCYPDLEPLRPALEARGLTNGAALADYLLEEHGLGILAGEHFGDDPNAYRYRVASSLLYGATSEQRWQALASDNPLTLPWIDQSLAELRSALGSLASIAAKAI